MRKLGFCDAFALARIIKAANLDEVITNFGTDVLKKQSSGEELNAEKVGFQLFVTIVCSISDEKTEEKIYKLYADIKGAKPEEVRVYDFETIAADMKQIIEMNNIKVFFDWLRRSRSALTGS
ncbi:MAG: hypothetical protein II190_01250 [Ruminococcus sp.]|nr:hypothetical protein [Ruminococcus sp.]